MTLFQCGVKVTNISVVETQAEMGRDQNDIKVNGLYLAIIGSMDKKDHKPKYIRKRKH